MYTNGAMTIYNKKTLQNKNVVYTKKIIDNVFWDSIEKVTENNNRNDEVVIYLPTDKNDMSDYVEPKNFNGTENKWTIQEGDIIVRGSLNISSINGIKDLKNYEAFTVYFIDNNDFGNTNMQHFKIRGR